MKHDELISREQAIDALDGVKVDEKNCDEYDIGYNDGINFAISKLSVLPTAQPEPCEDVVQWEQLERYADWFCADVSYPEFVREAKAFIKSVTPKQRTGYWYPVGMVEAVGGESAQWGSAIAYHKCSECDEQALRDDFEQEVLSKWCPHCGAKMEGASE